MWTDIHTGGYALTSTVVTLIGTNVGWHSFSSRLKGNC